MARAQADLVLKDSAAAGTASRPRQWLPSGVDCATVSVLMGRHVPEEVVPSNRGGQEEKGRRAIGRYVYGARWEWSRCHILEAPPAPDVAWVCIHTAPDRSVAIQAPLEALLLLFLHPAGKQPFNAAADAQHLGQGARRLSGKGQTRAGREVDETGADGHHELLLS